MPDLGEYTISTRFCRSAARALAVFCVFPIFGVGNAVGDVATAERIVSLSSIASEVVIGLGAASSLIAVDPKSGALPELTGVPVVRPEEIQALDPDLVIVPASVEGAPNLSEKLRRAGLDVLEFAPHDFDEAAAFCWALGIRIQRTAEAHAFARARTRRLAQLSSHSFGMRRPRIAVLVGMDPLTLAGGHSFLTDLVETAGAENVTHGVEEERVEMTLEALAALEPESLVVIGPREVPRDERRLEAARFASFGPLEYLVVEPERIWLHSAEDLALQLRALVCELLGDRERAGQKCSRPAPTG